MENPETPASEQPLAGLHFLITRPQTDKSCRFSELVEQLGGKTTRFPVIRLCAAPPSAEFENTLANLDKFEAVVFASRTGVQFFWDQLNPTAQNLLLSHCQIGAIGQSTADQISDLGGRVDLIPAESNSESLAELLTKAQTDQPFLIIRADRGSAVLAERLAKNGVPFQEIAVYQSIDVDVVDESIRKAVAKGDFDWIPMTSQAIAKNTVRLLGDHLHRSRIASLSPEISQVLRDLGFPPAVEAPQSNFASLLQAVSQRHGSEQ